MSGTAGSLAIPGPPGTPGPPGGPGIRIERAAVVTDSAGQATVTWDPPFPAPPVLALAVEAGGGFRSVRLTASTAASATVRADGAAVIEVLGLSVLAAALPAAGVTVHVIATEPQEVAP
ncbi:hypothetical protein [Actinacidiphila sp. ITFR-21]|uniref:hypothetical protein n=1 Tax=Actinacidiphila sp. ITFR-21 TaxID=3075199 RepID=UPI00288C5544|nr:hypothetical protein [Streptomyces sp. ITFR-21]WNI20277.1 hypothetical protein RLT57_32950 [Streptomyces sp. ITFR-21]